MRRHFSAIMGLLVCLLCGSAFAQEPTETPESEPEQAAVTEAEGISANEIVYWVIDSDDPKAVAEFRKGVADSLSGESGRHILSDEAFQKHVTDSVGPLPACFRGVEACISAKALAFDALGISQVIRVKLKPGEKVEANLDLVDSRGATVRSAVVSGANPREAAFAAIREIYDATGMLSVRTQPEGADLQVDGSKVGTTPYLGRFPVGSLKYKLTLDQHEPKEGSVEIRSGRSEVIEHEFDQQMGVLKVVGAPANARVFVNGELKGLGNERIKLPPGNYTIEVKAEGYEPLSDNATVEAGGEVERTAPMRPVDELFDPIGPESIILNNYLVRVGFEHVFQSTSYPNASSGGDNAVEFFSFPNDAGTQPTVGNIAKTIHGNGVRLDFSYAFRHFGLVLLSMSYHGASPDEDIFVRGTSGAVEPAKLTSLQRFQVRPFQVFYRHVYGNWVPFAEVGMGADFQWLGIESDVLEPVTLTQATPFYAIAFGAQYHFTPNYFATARYSLQGYFDSAIGSDHELLIGVGAAFSNIFGFDVEPPEKL